MMLQLRGSHGFFPHNTGGPDEGAAVHIQRHGSGQTGNTGGQGTTIIVFVNGEEVDRAAVAGNDTEPLERAGDTIGLPVELAMREHPVAE